jgi:hypothetical protein
MIDLNKIKKYVKLMAEFVIYLLSVNMTDKRVG